MTTKTISIAGICLVPIGPALLKQCPLGEDVDVSVERDALVIRPVRRQPRQGWAEALASRSRPRTGTRPGGLGGLPRDNSRLGSQGLGVVVRRFEIWVVSLDPVVGSEMQKPRPAVGISPDEMNDRLNTVLVAPLTRRGFVAPFRVPCQFVGVTGQIALDHVRSVDKRRLARRLGQFDPATAKTVLTTLRELFEE